jgi:hypothetical protein
MAVFFYMSTKTKYFYLNDIGNLKITAVQVIRYTPFTVLKQITNRFLFEELQIQGFIGDCNDGSCTLIVPSDQEATFYEKVAEFYAAD